VVAVEEAGGDLENNKNRKTRTGRKTKKRKRTRKSKSKRTLVQLEGQRITEEGDLGVVVDEGVREGEGDHDIFVGES
jgi:hypothetical protein